ncbi:DUF4253 domain-containing protein [Actinomycetospora chlora]|uniref:DUF4253 domain-containing protein n=1 Tax=Actinomycetospora chlora TaxID=663608 RepID=A0ABP9ANC1_9PSEU
MTIDDPASATPFRYLDVDDPARSYEDLLRAAPRTQRSPVWFGPDTTQWFGEVPVPSDLAVAVGEHDPAEVLSRWWPGPCPDGCACLDPYTGAFPPLIRASGTDRSRRRATLAEAVSFGREAGDLASLAVVDAERPADVPAALGWCGVINYPHQDLVGLSAVLRSWEERFGATLVWIGGFTLVLVVADPPRTREESERVAAEHFAFCPDQIDPQDGREPYSPRSYAREIRRARLWKFWWD